MRRYVERVLGFLHSSAGPTAVEYAILISLVLLTCIAAVQSMGTVVRAPFQTVREALDSSQGSVTSRHLKPKRSSQPANVKASSRR